MVSLNTVCWADIPVKNLDRAIAFYTAVLGSAVSKEGEGEFTFGLLPHSEQNASGCLVEMEDNEPSQKGPLVYLSVEGRIDAAVAEVERNNGKVVSAKHSIGRTDSAPSLLIQRATRSRSILTLGDSL